VKRIVLNGGLTPFDLGRAIAVHTHRCAKIVIWGLTTIQDSSVTGAKQHQYEILR
jgi:hypothetical protein